MLSTVWTTMILISVFCAILTDRIPEVSLAITNGSYEAVELLISILGIMCFWSGLMEIMKESGISCKITKLLMPILSKLFKELRGENEILEKISSNITANLLGLGNAATPIGLSAAKEMKDKLPPKKARRAITMLVVMNTASIQIIPTTIIAIRSSLGSEQPYSILLSVLCASVIAFATAIIITMILRKIGNY